GNFIKSSEDIIKLPAALFIKVFIEPDLVTFTVTKYGSIDTLINNAAGNFIISSEDLSINGWNAVVDTVLNGTWYCTQSVGKYWIKHGIQGNIINILATYAGKAGAFVVH